MGKRTFWSMVKPSEKASQALTTCHWVSGHTRPIRWCFKRCLFLYCGQWGKKKLFRHMGLFLCCSTLSSYWEGNSSVSSSSVLIMNPWSLLILIGWGFHVRTQVTQAWWQMRFLRMLDSPQPPPALSLSAAASWLSPVPNSLQSAWHFPCASPFTRTLSALCNTH